MLKFRTMVRDAELRREAILALDEGDGLLFKMRRIRGSRRPAPWLRRWSLDEFPQLFNVFLARCPGRTQATAARGGPRYSDDVHRRLVVKPGMTGLWQINGRSNLSREDAFGSTCGTWRLDARA